jgi:hypothetical protein
MLFTCESQSQFNGFYRLAFSNFIAFRQRAYEKPEKQSFQPLWDRLGKLLARHSFSTSEVLRPLSHGIVEKVEHHMLPCHLAEICEVVSHICSQFAHELSGRRVEPDRNGQSSRQPDFTEEKRKYERF